MSILKNARGEAVPEHLRRIAATIHDCVSVPIVMQQWRAIVASWCREKAEAASQAAGVRMPADYYPLPPGLVVFDSVAVLSAVHDFVYAAAGQRIGPHDNGAEKNFHLDYRRMRRSRKIFATRVMASIYGGTAWKK
jgi:hypothetical protein